MKRLHSFAVLLILNFYGIFSYAQIISSQIKVQQNVLPNLLTDSFPEDERRYLIHQLRNCNNQPVAFINNLLSGRFNPQNHYVFSALNMENLGQSKAFILPKNDSNLINQYKQRTYINDFYFLDDTLYLLIGKAIVLFKMPINLPKQLNYLKYIRTINLDQYYTYLFVDREYFFVTKYRGFSTDSTNIIYHDFKKLSRTKNELIDSCNYRVIGTDYTQHSREWVNYDGEDFYILNPLASKIWKINKDEMTLDSIAIPTSKKIHNIRGIGYEHKKQFFGSLESQNIYTISNFVTDGKNFIIGYIEFSNSDNLSEKVKTNYKTNYTERYKLVNNKLESMPFLKEKDNYMNIIYAAETGDSTFVTSSEFDINVSGRCRCIFNNQLLMLDNTYMGRQHFKEWDIHKIIDKKTAATPLKVQLLSINLE